MAEEEIYRKKSLERLSAPEDLSDYLRVTGPGIWMVLASVILVLVGILVWGALAHLETTITVDAEVVNNEATVYVTGADISAVKEGMTLRAGDSEGRIESLEYDEYGRCIVKARVYTDDGKYDARIVTESVTPVSFLIGR